MENTTHIATGHWAIKNGKGLASCLLFVLGIWLSGCSSLQLTVASTPVPIPTVAPVQVSPTAIATLQPTPLPTGLVLPTWSEVELPPGCFFHSLSPDLHWVMVMGCRHDLGDTNWIVQVDENGRLYNFRQIEGRLIPYLEGTGIIGFTPDSTQLIVERDKSFGFINLADLTQKPYIPGTPGTSGVTNLGVEIWSPDGRLCLVPGGLGTAQIVALSASDGTEDIVVDGIGRHGAQYTWSADGREIAYVEGDYHESMRARLIDLKTRQSRTLIESQFPASLTGASYSPDGRWIAVREQSLESSEEATLWLIDVKTEAKTRLTYSLFDVEVYDGWQDMVWSPDGFMLALRGSGEKNVGFVVIEISNGKIVHRGTKETGGTPLAWSTDGKSLLVLDFHEEPDSAIGNDILRWVQIK